MPRRLLNTIISPTIHYELTNHLGNVMAVITDEPTDAETPAVESLTDYYPFGMTMPGRSYNAHTLRHGFTGHEKESDLAEGIYTTQYRLYDARVGRWLSVDPLFEKYVGMSQYNYCMLNPAMLVDPDGRDVALMIAPEGASNFGHMAAIIQKSDGTCYYMTAGAAENAGLVKMITSGCDGGVNLVPLVKEYERNENGNILIDSKNQPIVKSYYKDVKEAYDYVRTMDKNNSEYTDYIIIKTTKEQDKRIFRNAKSTRDKLNKNKSNYHLLVNNCAEIVIFCVEDGTDIDIKDGFTPVPNGKFDNIKNSFEIEK